MIKKTRDSQFNVSQGDAETASDRGGDRGRASAGHR